MTDPYQNLANAIILTAVKDWRSARRKLKRKSNNKDAKILLEECESFFRSAWFASLTDVDGEMLIRKLYEEDR